MRWLAREECSKEGCYCYLILIAEYYGVIENVFIDLYLLRCKDILITEEKEHNQNTIAVEWTQGVMLFSHLVNRLKADRRFPNSV